MEIKHRVNTVAPSVNGSLAQEIWICFDSKDELEFKKIIPLIKIAGQTTNNSGIKIKFSSYVNMS